MHPEQHYKHLHYPWKWSTQSEEHLCQIWCFYHLLSKFGNTLHWSCRPLVIATLTQHHSRIPIHDVLRLSWSCAWVSKTSHCQHPTLLYDFNLCNYIGYILIKRCCWHEGTSSRPSWSNTTPLYSQHKNTLWLCLTDIQCINLKVTLFGRGGISGDLQSILIIVRYITTYFFAHHPCSSSS